ncbi:hypothetical protein E2C01_013268 [Portunus trituberculatus]|uniref:Uncharacterized protein n=1 Tax=Portunus trituberculatus TaxID=210409 RepID=A0A5B7DG63_PORTR|nr:hypothetical protein [Portunus trituberculatus]
MPRRRPGMALFWALLGPHFSRPRVSAGLGDKDSRPPRPALTPYAHPIDTPSAPCRPCHHRHQLRRSGKGRFIVTQECYYFPDFYVWKRRVYLPVCCFDAIHLPSPLRGLGGGAVGVGVGVAAWVKAAVSSPPLPPPAPSPSTSPAPPGRPHLSQSATSPRLPTPHSPSWFLGRPAAGL